MIKNTIIRRSESACSGNNLMQSPSRSENPKSKIQDPKSKIQNPKSKIQNPRSKIQDPKSKIQNPKSKRPRLGLPQKERILRQSKIQNPRSKIQNAKSQIRNPKSKIKNRKSKPQIQTPKSKRPVWILDFGVWIWGGRWRWLCSKRSCMGRPATRS